MDARARNRRVSIKKPVAGQDAIGQPTTTWENLITAGDGKVSANVRFLNGVETVKADAGTAVSKASVRIAYRTNVTTAMRVELGATVLRITAVLPDEGGKRHTDIACEVIA